MIPQPQGFAIVVEPIDRERIESLMKMLDKNSIGFSNKVIPGFEGPCLLNVVAAGYGIQFEDSFVRNHIRTGDKILGTISEMNIAKDFLDPKSHWEFDGKSYLVINTRDRHDVTGTALFLVERQNDVS